MITNYKKQINIYIGNRIRAIRKFRGLSQAQLGSMVGLSANRVHKYECAIRAPKLDMIQKFALALDVSPYSLVAPNPDSENGLAMLLFNLEDIYQLETVEIDGRVFLSSNNPDFENVIQKWHKIKLELINKPEDERVKIYNDFRWNYSSVEKQ